VAAGHQSIYPRIPGVPWWGAVVIATTATAVGFAFDAGSGNKQLTNVFAALYVVGCVGAVLAVRRSGVFTAVIQPPLILFCSVPGAYWLFHGAKVTGIKDILINCGYPLIERFPLMLFTSAVVLLIGMARWFFGMTRRVSAKTNAGAATADARKPGIIAKLTAVWSRDSAGKADEAPATGSRREHAIGHSPKSARSASGGRPTRRPAPTRSRHVRPPLDEPEPTFERPRRRRPTPARDFDAEPPGQRRRPRPARDPDLRTQPPRESGEIRTCAVVLTSGLRLAGADWTRTSPWSPPSRSGLTSRSAVGRHLPGQTAPMQHITPSHGSAIGVQPAMTRGPRSRGPGGGVRASRTPNPGSTTSDRLPISVGPAGSPAAARTPASRWPLSPAAPRCSRSRPAVPAHRAPAPRGLTHRR